MGNEKLDRIMWRLREKTNGKDFKLKDIRLAVYAEVGLDERTVEKYIQRLIYCGYIKRFNLHCFRDNGIAI